MFVHNNRPSYFLYRETTAWANGGADIGNRCLVLLGLYAKYMATLNLMVTYRGVKELSRTMGHLGYGW